MVGGKAGVQPSTSSRIATVLGTARRWLVVAAVLGAALGSGLQPMEAQATSRCFNETPPGDVGAGLYGPGGWYYVGVDTGIYGDGPGACIITPNDPNPGTVVMARHSRSTGYTYGKIPVCVGTICKDAPGIPVMVDTGYDIYTDGTQS
ncbi:MAG: hypothetical protein HY775_01930 [Acidobacteria bacterium]|nr:hypothetical protein [Acidobacteriota bacterium]